MQSEAISFAYRSWRRAWRGRGKEYTSGVLVWQLNDCWPVTSWAIADYFIRPKPSYFTIARELAPFSVGIFRTFYEFGAMQSHDATIDVWATNSTLQSRHVKLELSYHDLNSQWTASETHDVEILPNQSTELLSIRCPGPPTQGVQPPSGDPIWTPSYSVVVNARLIDEDRGVLARFADWPQPYRYLALPDPDLAVKVDGETVTVSVGRPVKGLWLSIEGEEKVSWTDNCLDIVPGDPQVVGAKGLEGRRIKVAYLGKERASFI
ncbi:hypothetical protein H0H93_000719 [Arthromyces matolae]|nr:hypothetical protein H0H93_000719 [Arthromyces matolae]